MAKPQRHVQQNITVLPQQWHARFLARLRPRAGRPADDLSGAVFMGKADYSGALVSSMHICPFGNSGGFLFCAPGLCLRTQGLI